MIKSRNYGEVTQFLMGRDYEGQVIYTMACYYLDGLLIDSGPFHVAAELEAAFADYPIMQIINTHHHEDHIGNNVWFQENRRIGPVLAPAAAVPLIEDPSIWSARIMPYCQITWGIPPASLAQPLPARIDTDSFDLLVIPTPGHSPDHISLLEPSKGWLFAGDLFLAEKVTTLRSDEDVNIMLQSLYKLLDFDFELLFCASGRVVETEAKKAVQAKIAYWEEQREAILGLHRAGSDEDEILRRLYGKESALFGPSEGDFGKIHLIRSFILSGPSKPYHSVP
ncbi:MAG: MBL fold metallo-hydrolase [Deltaproteobacteria bacterium]